MTTAIFFGHADSIQTLPQQAKCTVVGLSFEQSNSLLLLLGVADEEGEKSYQQLLQLIELMCNLSAA